MNMRIPDSATKALSKSIVGYSTKDNHPDYIASADTRKKIGNLIEASTSACFFEGARKDGVHPRIAYFRAQIDLLQARPQPTVEDLVRCKRTVDHFEARIQDLS